MQKQILIGIVLCSCGVVAAQQSTFHDSTISRSLTYDFEIRQAVENSDALGVDFDLRYEVARRGQRDDPKGHLYSFKLTAKGFQDFAQEVKEFDYMGLEAVWDGQLYVSGFKPLTTEERKRHADLSARFDILTARDISSLSSEEKRAVQTELDLIKSPLKVLSARQSNEGLFFAYNGHYRLETTQDFSVKQHAVGVGITGDVLFLHDLFDLITEAFAPRQMQHKVQPVRMHLGFDYITKREADSSGAIAETKGFPRARLEAAWKTKILDNVVLRATLEVQHIFKPPADIKMANRETNSFFQIWLEHPLSEKFGVLAKFAEGRLPPLYTNTSEGKIGFRISFN